MNNLSKSNLLGKINDTAKINILLSSFLIVALALTATWLMIPINFETNDDTGIMGYITGARTGTPEADTIFSTYLWGRAVSALYIINSKVPWYILIFLSLIFVSLWTICYCVMRICRYQKKRFIQGIIIFLALYCYMFLYYSVLIQFTAVSAYCGIASVALLQTVRYVEDKGKRVFVNFIIFFLMLFSASIRMKIGYMVLGSALCVILFEIGYVCLFRGEIKNLCVLRNMIISFTIMIAALMLSLSVHYLHENRSEWRAFREFHQERALYTDYAKMSYEETEKYKDVGWSENLYNLTTNWFFMDEAVNTDTLRSINEEIDSKSIKVSSILNSLVGHERMIGLQMAIWVLLLLFCLYNSIIWGGRSGRQMIPFLWMVIWLFGIIFLAYRGRVVRRGLESWTLLTLIPSSIEILQSNIKIQKNKENFAYVFITALCIVSFGMKSGLYCNARQISDEIQLGKKAKEKVEDYVMERQDNLYIYDSSLAFSGNPWSTYSERKPYNLIFWGGSGYSSPLYYKQIKKNGFDSIYEEDFFRENVFFLGQSGADQNLIDFMEERYLGCVCEVIDKNELFVIYKFFIRD